MVPVKDFAVSHAGPRRSLYLLSSPYLRRCGVAYTHYQFGFPSWPQLRSLCRWRPSRSQNGNPMWLRIERTVIVFLAAVYVANTIAEVADMIGLITLHPSGGNPFSLLSSAVAIWLVNVLAFALLYWQIDGGGTYVRTSKAEAKPDWVFPQQATLGDTPPDWRPLFIDYLYLGYNTATALSPTDALPLTHRAKMLMMTESTISLLTSVVILSRAISVLPG